jgi:hypothetical protein
LRPATVKAKLDIRLISGGVTILFFLAILPPLASRAQELVDVCQQSENILPNCDFSSGLAGWQTFTEAGSARIDYLQGGGECHAPLCPAAYIVTNDHFVGGLYQQVQVAKGNSYYANIVWLVFDSLTNDASVHQATGGIGRRIGVDPFGGTDSTSANIVWSPDNWRNDCKICNIEEVFVTAQADTITVFLRIDDTWKLRAAEKGLPVPPSDDQFWIDDIGLKQVSGDAVPTDPPPTDTPAPPPPTDTPIPDPPTNTPLPPANTSTPVVEAATEISQVDTPAAEPLSPVATPSAATSTPIAAPPTLTPSPTPSATHTPRTRPTVTPTRIRRGTPTPEPSQLPLVLGAVGTTACLGGGALLIVGVVVGGLVWLYRLNASGADDEYGEDEGVNDGNVD